MQFMSFLMFRRVGLILVTAMLGFAGKGEGQISKGHQILIDRGLQIQGMVNTGDIFHLPTYTNAHYSSINWIFNSDTSQMGPTPGFPWGRWVDNITNMPPLGSEASDFSQLVSLSLSDEPYLDNTNDFINMMNWFTNVQSGFPNTILYVNNWGGEVSDGALSAFIAQAKPDMVTFDFYPWQSDYNSGTPISLTQSWYGELRRYRAWAATYNIPFGIYRQTFHAVQDYNSTIYRDPSLSELRLNTFGAMAFSAKMLIDFTYNTGASSLFDHNSQGQWAGDTYTNAVYNELADINLRAANLGKALVRLRPTYDLHNTNTLSPPPGPGSDDPTFPNGYTTSTMFLRGKYMTGSVTNFTPLPDSFLNDPSSSSNPNLINSSAYSWWEFQKYDPYLSGWSMTNKAGVMNNGLPGEVIITWMRPLDEAMDGITYSNEVYLMVVNGLTATNGTAADCLQEIKLNFVGLSGAMTNLIMLDSLTGSLKTNGLPLFSTKRQLTLDLNGGDAVLFKFNTGAPFVGFYPPQAAKLSAKMQGANQLMTLQGVVGGRYQVQVSPSPLTNSWTTVTNLILPSSPYVFTNLPAATGGRSFYRVVATP